MQADEKLPRLEDVKAIDMMIAELDALEPDSNTSPYSVIVEEWIRFSAFIALLDAAVKQPFVDGAAALLISASGLDDMTFNLAFWLSHAGEAITRYRSKGVK